MNFFLFDSTNSISKFLENNNKNILASKLKRKAIKKDIRSYRCKTIEDLITACKDFQKKVTPEYCQNFINKLKKNVQIVINNKGGWSNF